MKQFFQSLNENQWFFTSLASQIFDGLRPFEIINGSFQSPLFQGTLMDGLSEEVWQWGMDLKCVVALTMW